MRSLCNAKDRRAVCERLQVLTPDDRALWGRMDVVAMLLHLRESFRGAMGERCLTPKPPPIPANVYKFLALRVPVRWPKNVETTAELKALGPVGVRDEFAQRQAEVTEYLSRFCAKESALAPHPMFGAMSYGDWMRWGFLHTDHHLRQFGR